MIFWRGNPHLCVSPLSSLRLAIHPFVALPTARRISPSAEGDQRCAALDRRALFEEKKQTRKRDLREFASQTVAPQKLSQKLFE